MKAMRFRNSFFGGFNKADVMKYIEELQKKQPQTSQKLDDETAREEIIALKKENERLVLALEKANEQIERLNDKIDSSSQYIEKKNDAAENLHTEIDFEDENIKEILSQGYELIEENGLKQLEISKIIDDLKSRYE